MNVKQELKLITILGWLLNNVKLDDEHDRPLQRKMNQSLLDLFAEVLSESADKAFVQELLTAIDEQQSATEIGGAARNEQEPDAKS